MTVPKGRAAKASAKMANEMCIRDSAGPDPDRGIAGQEGDGDRRGAEQEHGDCQLRSFAVGTVDGHEDDGAERSCSKGQRKNGKRIERSGQGIDVREDKPGKDDDRRDGVDEEVEEFRRPTDDDADRDLARVHVAVAGIGETHVPFSH